MCELYELSYDSRNPLSQFPVFKCEYKMDELKQSHGIEGTAWDRLRGLGSCLETFDRFT